MNAYFIGETARRLRLLAFSCEDQYRLRIDLRERRLSPAVQPIENINSRIWRSRTNEFGFRNIGNEKSLTAGFGQRPRDRAYTATVGIAFDHGGAFSLGALCQVAPIGCNSRQIDHQDAAGFCFSRPVGHYACRFVLNSEPTPSIDDFAGNRTLDDDLRARLDCQIAEEVSTNMQEAVRLDDRIVDD